MNDKDLFNQYVEKMESIDDDYFHNLNRDLFKGHNSYLRMRMKGSSFFNDEWISKIEDCIYELGQIVNNPLEVTTTEGNLTPIELAKKINYESVQHLASHSQYVKDIDEQGNVIPAKILSQFHKEELHTYENRFIATFIRRLMLFVEKRYEFIRTTVNFDTKDVLYIKNKSIVDGQEVSIETKVTVKKENEDTESKIGKEYVERVQKMRKYVNFFYNSPFMKELKTEKDVRKPILQTNIIRKNPLYHKCYETFLFIERFNTLGVEYALDEHYQSFSEKERKALNYILASHLLSLGSTEKSRTYKKSKKTYKPKLLSSIDDEMFIYGDLLKGPIEFVRVDEKYNEYLKKKADMNNIPKKPNKVEKEYFKEEIDLKKNTEKHIKEIESLLRRIRREIAKWEKLVEQLLAERQIEEAKEAQAKLEELRRQEQDILERKRAAIIAAALGDKTDNIPEKNKEKPAKTKIEEPVIDENYLENDEEYEEPILEEIPDEEEIIEEVKEPTIEEQPVLANIGSKDEAMKAIEDTAKIEGATIEEPKEENIETKPLASESKEEVKADEQKTRSRKRKAKANKKPIKEEKLSGNPEDFENKPSKKETRKKAKKESKKPEIISEPEAQKDILKAIPGKFIVKTLKGYYISDTEFSNLKSKAIIFKDFNKARRIKEIFGGKVIKL